MHPVCELIIFLLFPPLSQDVSLDALFIRQGSP